MQTAQAARYPLAIGPDRRHVVDADGTPFLLTGDAAWSLLVGLDRDEALRYLRQRATLGFNGIIVNLIERLFCPDPPRTVDGLDPFTTPDDFSSPNERYFDHAVWVAEQAAAHGMVVLLAPCYLGYVAPHYPGWGGQAEGWFEVMLANGVHGCGGYGRYVGERFAHLDNIVWVLCGDRDPTGGIEHVRAIARGLLEARSDRLCLAHLHPEHQALDFFDKTDDDWLTLNMTYSYEIVHRALATHYERFERPNVLFESTYENEHNSSELQIRRQAYWAATCGAFGHCLGTYPTWMFGDGWEAALLSAGSIAMSHFASFFGSLPWWTLVPDLERRFVVGGRGEHRGLNYASAALAPDGSLAVVYVPEARPVRLDFQHIAGAKARITRFDPVTGVYDEPALVPSDGARELLPITACDWAIIVEAS